MQLLNAFNSGAKGSASGFGGSASKAFGAPQEESKRVEPLSFKGSDLPNVQSKLGGGRPGGDNTD